jgi:hypothetical protein
MDERKSEDIARFAGYRANIDQFVQDALSAAIIDNVDYVPGSQRIDFYEHLFETPDGFRIYDHVRAAEDTDPGPYEEALYQRMMGVAPGMMVLIGGLGSGKSTAIRYLTATIDSRRPQIAAAYPCLCQPCVRRPILINCLDLDRTFTTNECEAEVLMRIRREIYTQLIDEWLLQNGEPISLLTGPERKVIRRLIIANDIYSWADSEALEFPAALRTARLELPGELLSMSPADWEVKTVVREYAKAAIELDKAIQDAIANVPLGKRFTALVLGFWLRSCNPKSPNNLVVVDNLDQQPTDNIEQIVNHLHDLDIRNRGVRLLLPLRPSSIVPHGFTKNTNYMYHYGPNCFDVIYRRLQKNLLTLSRAQLVSAVFATKPSPEEITAVLVATYIYALVCINGLSAKGRSLDADVRPSVHDDHEFLHRIQFAGPAIQQLSDTLEAVVGTCGRYATDQLRRYFDHIYSHPTFLRQVEIAGLAVGTAPRLAVPYGQIVTAVLGAHDADSGVTGLANLYSPTEFRANPDLPSLAKLRILMFLAGRGRVRVGAVVAALAQNGIPFEIAIDALNYLHLKNRLLLWFSRNADISRTNPDVNQFVVISEHGQAYVRNLVGDFEYVWFCAQQILARTTADAAQSFRARLGDYQRLLIDVARTEWKQMTFRRCSSSAVWPLATAEIKGDEMIALFVLYSSLERALRAAAIAVRRRDPEYVADVATAVGTIVDLILQRQDDYELYFGNNGYLVAYAQRISRCRRAVAALAEKGTFEQVETLLRSLITQWGIAVHEVWSPSVESAEAKVSEHPWIRMVAELDANVLRAGEDHGREILLTSLRRYLARRVRLATTLATRFPVFSYVDHELALLLEENRVTRDAAAGLSRFVQPLLDWLESELLACQAISEDLKSMTFSVPDNTTMSAMDEFKAKANGVSMAFGALSQRLGSARTDHLAVRWSI